MCLSFVCLSTATGAIMKKLALVVLLLSTFSFAAKKPVPNSADYPINVHVIASHIQVDRCNFETIRQNSFQTSIPPPITPARPTSFSSPITQPRGSTSPALPNDAGVSRGCLMLEVKLERV